MIDKTQLEKRILHHLQEMQAIDIVCLDVSHQTSVTDEMIICSGRSSRHVKAIAATVLEKIKEEGCPALGDSGVEQGDWALLDFGDVVVHVMQPDSRSYYDLEGLWSEKEAGK